MKFPRILALAALSSIPLVAPTLLWAQQGPTAPVLHSGAAEITLDGRVQALFDTSSGDSVAPSEIRMRRIYLGVTAQLNDFVTGKIQADFAGNRVSLKDAYVKLTLSPALHLLAGNAYRPFSRLASATSDVRILPIERGLSIRGVQGLEEQSFLSSLAYSERDVGVQVMGERKEALGLEFAAGVFAGPLAGEVGPQDSYQYAGRVSLEPLDGFSVGTGFSSRDFAPTRTADPRPELRRGTAWEADLEVGTFAPGFHLLAEVTTGDVSPFADSDFTGAAAWLAYRTQTLSRAVSALEPTFRVSTGRLDGDLEPLGGTLLTPGINVYFGGNNRVMLDLDHWDPAGGAAAQRSFKAMVQMAF